MIYLVLFYTFFKIGAFTFGGGYAMLPLIRIEVLNHGWVTEEAIVNFIAVSESTPGPFAINMATYVGMETAGLFGAFCATLGVVLPSFIIILIVAHFFEKFKNSRVVKGLMTGLKPAVIGLILSAVISIGQTVFFSNGIDLKAFSGIELYISLIIFVVMTTLALKKKHPILIITLSALIGIAVGYILGL